MIPFELKYRQKDSKQIWQFWKILQISWRPLSKHFHILGVADNVQRYLINISWRTLAKMIIVYYK